MTERRTFGKFELKGPLPLRNFEIVFKIGSRSGVDAWQSEIQSIQNLLSHLGRFTRSESSRVKYLRHVLQLCRWSGLSPEKLVVLSKERVEGLVQGLVDDLATKDCSRAYVNTVMKRLKTFFRVNGYFGSRELQVKGYFVPTRYRKNPEYVPIKSEVYSMADASGGCKNRALILLLWTTGVRVSTCCAIDFGDLANELENGEPHVMIPVYLEMKRRITDACKGSISYHTFLSIEAGEALRTYLKERKEKFGEISFDDPLFFSNWTLWRRDERSSRRLGRRGIGLIVKRAARLAGIAQWRYVTPHCLRKAFESVLRSPTVDGGRMDEGTREFLMGHILPSSQDAYYDKTNVDFHRSEYSKLDFSRDGQSAKTVDKLIDIPLLEEHLNEGWLFVAKINENKAVVRKSE